MNWHAVEARYGALEKRTPDHDNPLPINWRWPAGVNKLNEVIVGRAANLGAILNLPERGLIASVSVENLADAMGFLKLADDGCGMGTGGIVAGAFDPHVESPLVMVLILRPYPSMDEMRAGTDEVMRLPRAMPSRGRDQYPSASIAIACNRRECP